MATTAATTNTRITGFDEDGNHFEITLDGFFIREKITRAGRVVDETETDFPNADEARDAFEATRRDLAPTGPASISSTFVDEADGLTYTIALHGTQVVFTDAAGALTSTSLFATPEEAAADYANWYCDDAAAKPQARDVVEIFDLGGRTYRVIAAVAATQHGWLTRVRPAVGNRFGRELTVDLVAGRFQFKTREVAR